MQKLLKIIIFILPLLSFAETKYIEKYYDIQEHPYTFELKFDKYIQEDLQHFVYITKATQIKEKANINAKNIKNVKYGERIPTTALIENNKTKWYEVLYNNKTYYIKADKGIKRAFDWQKAINKAYEINDFFVNAFNDEKEIYYLNSYVSLSTDTDGVKDKYGNHANQSIKAYYGKNKYINLPDRSLFIIIKEDNEFVYIRTLAYGDTIYKVNKADKAKLKKADINEIVNKFIYVDRNSQTQISIERDIETNIFNINAGSFVTTGISKGVGFITPYGIYKVAYTKPVMKYVSDYEKEQILNSKGEVIGEKPIIIGEAPNAIRFSGGAYIHGVPFQYGTEQEMEARRKYTASKLGTVPLSHKCVRNADDVEKYMYKWVNGNNKMQKNGFTYPEETVIVIIE